MFDGAVVFAVKATAMLPRHGAILRVSHESVVARTLLTDVLDKWIRATDPEEAP